MKYFALFLDWCKEENLNDIMDNIITVALSNRPIAIVLLTVLGKQTFCRLLQLNRDIGDNVQILSELTKKIDVDELFEC